MNINKHCKSPLGKCQMLEKKFNKACQQFCGPYYCRADKQKRTIKELEQCPKGNI